MVFASETGKKLGLPKEPIQSESHNWVVLNLLDSATPRTREILEKISKRVSAGALTEDDIVLLEQITDRFGSK